MSEKLISTSSVMEGKGAYNKHVKLPAGGAALALPLLAKAIQNMKLDLDGRSVVIADYGSSQGQNSLAPMQFAIRNLRSRIGENRPILVFHIDQPTNDFNSLFEVLATDPDRYALQEPHVFPCAIGRSFYEKVLPPESVHLGWSSYAAVWLSGIPILIPGHFISLCSSDAARAEFERQGAQDWESFLSSRASELLPGGRLVVVLPGVAENGSSGFEGIMNHANAVLADMAEEGAITAAEQARMVSGSHPRRKDDLLAPFAKNGRFQDLTVEAFDESVLSDSAWADYERDGDGKALAAKHALFFRSVFMPSLASAITRVRDGDGEALTAFGDRLENGLKGRLAKQPAAMHSFVHTIVLAK
jgi:SAM dependent carboxyl methyltransferase